MGGDRVTIGLLLATIIGLASLFTRRFRRTREATVMWTLIAIPAATLALAWIASQITPAWVPRYFAPVLGVDLRTEPCVVLDLSVGSALVSGDPVENTEPALTRRITVAAQSSSRRKPGSPLTSGERGDPGFRRDDELPIAIGRWDEPRGLKALL